MKHAFKYRPQSLAILVIFLFSCTGSTQGAGQGQASPNLVSSSTEWVEYENNPVISYGDTLDGILWNDPSVIKENSGYRMWLSGGKPFEVPIVVKVYEAYSNDGIEWDINPIPVLEPGQQGAWDDLRTETPAVIKVGDTYHMYYSGCDTPCNAGVYDIGHATSTDGVAWVKDPANPVLIHHNDPLQWGFYTAAEPSAVFHDGTFYLYYTSAKSNWPDYGSPFSILLATSQDGSNFTAQGSVYELTSSYDAMDFRGYSTPMAFVDDGIFHLYHDIVYSPGNPNGFEQVAISHATSADGYSFTETDVNIVAVESGWKNVGINGPTVLVDEGVTKMWFAAQTDEPDFNFGIGYASKGE